MSFLTFKIKKYNKFWGGIENEEVRFILQKLGYIKSEWFMKFQFEKHKKF